MKQNTDGTGKKQPGPRQGHGMTGWRWVAGLMKQEDNPSLRLWDNLEDAVSMVKNGRRIFANKRFLEIFGYDRLQEVLNRSITMVIHPDDHQPVFDYNRRKLTGKTVPPKYICTGIRKNGVSIRLEVSTTLTFINQIPLLVDFMRPFNPDDLSRTKGWHAPSAAAKVGEIREIVHEFNNLLSVVLGNLAICMEMDRSSKNLEPFLREADNAARKVQDRIKNLGSGANGKEFI